MTLREIKASLHKRILEFQHLQDRGRHRIFLFVYVSGHGVSENGQQCFVLNQETGKQNLFTVEDKLRKVSQMSQTSVLAFYDCCRQDAASVAGLLASRGGIAQGQQQEEE